jgi:uncharacterized protein YkwD
MLPARGIARVARWLRRSAVVQVALLIGAVAIVVAGLLIGLPIKSVSAQTLPTFAPLAPQAAAHRTDASLPLDVPFQVTFTKPMNESTVRAALTIAPQIEVSYEWDATGQILAVRPNPHWTPYTHYTIDIGSGATDQEGLGLTTPIHAEFESGAPTAGKITATKMVGARAAPGTAFVITFTRPVKMATVEMRANITPHVDFAVSGDDPTDAASQVFTLTPNAELATDAAYVVAMNDGGSDSAGAPLQRIASLDVTTLPAPTVVKHSPGGGSVTLDTNQPISITFSMAMDPKTAAAALSVTADGRAVSGSTYWTESNTVLVFTPQRSFYIGATVTVSVATKARSADGIALSAASGFSFSVSQRRSGSSSSGTSTKIPLTGGVASSSAPYHSYELYYLALMNCTRTGGWVTSSGDCSTVTHHTLPARGPLSFNNGIANAVSRPYARALALSGALTHYLNGSTPHGRLSAGGYPSGAWGENIASPSNPYEGGMIAVEIFFQNEYWCRCAHYYNIMNSHFNQAGVGIWVEGGTRVVIDFYG